MKSWIKFWTTYSQLWNDRKVKGISYIAGYVVTYKGSIRNLVKVL